MPSKRSSKVDLLGKVGLFSECTRKELAQIASLVDEVWVSPGKTLTLEGQPGDEFFVIVEGRASVTRGAKKVAVLGPGAFFGEMALLDRGPRTATVTASEAMKLFVIEARNFAGLLDRAPSVGRKIMRALAARLRAVEKSATH